MTDREIFRQNLNEIIRLQKAKQIDIARYIGISEKTVSAWTTGRGYPRPDAMEQLCKFFNIRKSALTDDPNDEASDEENLLTMYRSLTVEGKAKLIERAEELIKLMPNRRRKNGETD